MSAEKGVQLLIVEDDPALQKQIKWSLDQFESVTADDRESALVQLRRHAPAVVTMDLGLPPNADDSTEGFLLLEQIVSLAPEVLCFVPMKRVSVVVGIAPVAARLPTSWPST